MTATKMTGKEIMAWMRDRCPKWGSLLAPEAKFPLTVGEVEEACGKGAIARAAKYCEKRDGKKEFGAAFPYACRVITIIESQIISGKTQEEAEKYLREYWIPKYGSDTCLHTVPHGQERADDAVRMHYPVVA